MCRIVQKIRLSNQSNDWLKTTLLAPKIAPLKTKLRKRYAYGAFQRRKRD